MTLSALLESFDDDIRAPGPVGSAPSHGPGGALSEADRLAAYEEGYRSGWDDCIAADREEAKRISAELSRNLSDIGFTYHEARTQLLAEVEGLLGAFFATVIPRLSETAVAARLVDDLLDLAGNAVDRPCEIVVTASDAGIVRGLLQEVPTVEVRIVEESALAPGQAYLRLGSEERFYDLSDMADRLLAALSSNPSNEIKETAGDIAG